MHPAGAGELCLPACGLPIDTSEEPFHVPGVQLDQATAATLESCAYASVSAVLPSALPPVAAVCLAAHRLRLPSSHLSLYLACEPQLFETLAACRHTLAMTSSPSIAPGYCVRSVC